METAGTALETTHRGPQNQICMLRRWCCACLFDLAAEPPLGKMHVATARFAVLKTSHEAQHTACRSGLRTDRRGPDPWAEAGKVRETHP
jgi:hypothetical protein